jgi:hypothetical protein
MTHGTEEPSPSSKARISGSAGAVDAMDAVPVPMGRGQVGFSFQEDCPRGSDVDLIPSEADFEIRFAHMSIRFVLPSSRSMEPPIPRLIALHTCRDVHVLGRETRHRGSGPRAIGGRWLWFCRCRQCSRTFHHDGLERTDCPSDPGRTSERVRERKS